jgi:hypothetical protein
MCKSFVIILYKIMLIFLSFNLGEDEINVDGLIYRQWLTLGPGLLLFLERNPFWTVAYFASLQTSISYLRK